jgi:hypothetical protein
MKAEHFAKIHCKKKAELQEVADKALLGLMDSPQKVASATGQSVMNYE